MIRLRLSALVFIGIGVVVAFYSVMTIKYAPPPMVGIISSNTHLILFIAFIFGLIGMFLNGMASERESYDKKNIEVKQK